MKIKLCICGEEIYPKNGKKFCSQSCKQKNYRNKKKGVSSEEENLRLMNEILLQKINSLQKQKEEIEQSFIYLSNVLKRKREQHNLRNRKYRKRKNKG